MHYDNETKLVAIKALLAKRLVGLGYFEAAGKMSACHQEHEFYVCHECGQSCKVALYHCRHRLCPMCARARVSRLLEVYKDAFKSLQEPKLLTISMRSRPSGELREAVNDLWAAFKRLRHRGIWLSVRGAIACLEVTFNKFDQTWHPHLHIVVDSGFIVWKRLRDAWGDITSGEGSAVYIQKCRVGWERELIKYITKTKPLLGDCAALKEFLDFSKGRRFIRTYGSLYNCQAEREETRGEVRCRGCGAVMTLEKARVMVEEVYDGHDGLQSEKENCFKSQTTFGVT